MSLKDDLDEALLEIQTRSADDLLDFVSDLPDQLPSIATKCNLSLYDVKVRAIAALFPLLDSEVKDLRDATVQALFEIAKNLDDLLERILQAFESAEIKKPGLFNSYESREYLVAIPVARIESWIYRILNKIPQEKLDSSFAFFCHEALFSYRDYIRLKNLNQISIADMLEDDLLMTSERLLGECYRELGMTDRFTLDPEYDCCLLVNTPRALAPLRVHWTELKKVSPKSESIQLNLRYTEALLFDVEPRA